jgi:hypothetical protein
MKKEFRKTRDYLVKMFIISQELEKYYQNRILLTGKFSRFKKYPLG